MSGFECPHCRAAVRFVRCPRCSMVVVADLAWSTWRCLTCGQHHLQRVSSALAVAAADYWKASGGKARAGVADPTFANPEVRSRLQRQISVHRLQRDGRCLMCGYSGSMAICYRHRPWYATGWFLVPMVLLGVGILVVLFLILFSPVRDYCVCPACEAAVVFK